MAITLASNALVTLEEVRVTFGITFPMTADASGSYSQLINDASDYAESHCGQTFLSGSLATEVFDGQGISDRYDIQHTQHMTENAPILGTPKLYNYNGNEWVLMTTTTEFDSSEGVIYFPGVERDSGEIPVSGNLGGTGSFFVAGTRNYKVEYEYGYDGSANVPNRVKRAVVLHVKFNKVANEHLGTESTGSSDGRSKSYTWDKIPGMIDDLLEPFVRTKNKQR